MVGARASAGGGLGKNNNMLLGAYRYGPDYIGLKGNIGVAEKVKPVPEKKVQPRAEKGASPKGEEALKERLANLGY